MKISSGLLMYRLKNGLEVLLAHPGGPWWSNNWDHCWTVPKGEVDNLECGLLDNAIREFSEETGLVPEIETEYISIENITQRSGKVVFCWAFNGENLDIEKFKSNTCTIEWPSGSGQSLEIPEVDKIEWFNIETAKEKINPTQIPFLDRLVDMIGIRSIK
jgi:predicted NUDIX family NTP pyrophosphohydrolase